MPLYLGLNSNLDSSAISLINTLLNVQVPLALRPELLIGFDPINVVVEVVPGTIAVLPTTAAELFNIKAEDVVEEAAAVAVLFPRVIFVERADISVVFYFFVFVYLLFA